MNLITPDLSQMWSLGYVVLAMFLGALLGLEREMAGKPAGLRTHMLVAGGAALLVIISLLAVEIFQRNFEGDVVRTDPIRVLEAVITGISFLGAGTILRDRATGSVEGLTTAASLLLAAAVGMTVALEQLVLALGVVVITIVILRVVPHFENWLRRFFPQIPEQGEQQNSQHQVDQASKEVQRSDFQ
jgi:putative Mg2+ transporter-C (MgtC) family protein